MACTELASWSWSVGHGAAALMVEMAEYILLGAQCCGLHRVPKQHITL